MVTSKYMALKPLISIKDLIAKKVDRYFYIYLITSVSDLNVGSIILIIYQARVSLESMLPKHSLPYRNPQIINVICCVLYWRSIFLCNSLRTLISTLS